MAITFGSNIGSASKGAFAIFPVNDSVGGASFDILDADVVTGAVVAVTGGVALTTNQEAALSASFAKLLAGVPAGSVTGNELEFLQKLVGVLSLTSGATITLSAVNTAGDVWRLSASISLAGEALVYVPNSAAAGLFTGQGSSGGAVTPPVVPYDMAVPLINGTAPLGNNYPYAAIIASRPVTLPSLAALHQFKCGAAPTAQYVIGVVADEPSKAPFALGTITFAIGSTTGVFAFTNAQRSFEAYTLFTFIGQPVGDATFANFFGTLRADVTP